jgi:hypothetical protein
MGIPGLLRTPFADLVFGPWHDRAAVPVSRLPRLRRS